MHRDLWICFSIFILLRDSGTNKVLFSRTVSDRYLLRFVHLLAFFTFYVFLYLCVPTGASPGLFLPKTMTFQHFLKKTKKRASEQMSMVDQNALNQKRKETVENRNPEYLTVFTKTHSKKTSKTEFAKRDFIYFWRCFWLLFHCFFTSFVDHIFQDSSLFVCSFRTFVYFSRSCTNKHHNKLPTPFVKTKQVFPR